MIKDAGNMSFLDQKWLQNIVERVGHQLHTRKNRDILLSAIEAGAREIEHTEGRIALARAELESMQGAIERLQRQGSDSRRKSERLRADREQAEEEFLKLKDVARNMDKKLAALPQMREKAIKLRAEVQRTNRRLDALRSDRRDARQRKQNLEEDCKALKDKGTPIEQEIAVMQNTFTILTGQRPENFDPETFKAIQDNVEKKAEDFTREMTGEIDKLKEETRSLEARLADKMRGQKPIVAQETELREALDELKARMDEKKSPAALQTEVEKLKDQEKKLRPDLDEKKNDIQGFESAIATVIKRIKEEEELKSQLDERLAYLKPRQEEVRRLGDNVVEEIQRLKDKTGKLKSVAKGNSTAHETVKGVIGELEPLKREMVACIEGYDQRFSELERDIEDLLTAPPDEAEEPKERG